MKQALANTNEPQPRWRISLRTAMVVMFAGCILLGISAIVGPRRFIAMSALAIPLFGLISFIYGGATLRYGWGGLGAALLLLSFVLVPILWTAKLWSGFRTVPITVSVIDAQTQLPIANAQVTWADDGRATSLTTTPSDAQGRATFVRDYMTSGVASFAEDRASMSFGSHAIRVTAPGYAPVSFRLAERVGLGQDLADPLPSPIRIELHPGDDSTAPENDPLREHFVP